MKLLSPAQTPLGALSVVICAILSHFFLKESLTIFGSIGCALCIVCLLPLIAFPFLISALGWCGRYRPERPSRGECWADRRVPEVIPSAGLPFIYWRCYSGIPWYHHLRGP